MLCLSILDHEEKVISHDINIVTSIDTVWLVKICQIIFCPTPS